MKINVNRSVSAMVTLVSDKWHQLGFGLAEVNCGKLHWIAAKKKIPSLKVYCTFRDGIA